MPTATMLDHPSLHNLPGSQQSIVPWAQSGMSLAVVMVALTVLLLSCCGAAALILAACCSSRRRDAVGESSDSRWLPGVGIIDYVPVSNRSSVRVSLVLSEGSPDLDAAQELSSSTAAPHDALLSLSVVSSHPSSQPPSPASSQHSTRSLIEEVDGIAVGADLSPVSEATLDSFVMFTTNIPIDCASSAPASLAVPNNLLTRSLGKEGERIKEGIGSSHMSQATVDSFVMTAMNGTIDNSDAIPTSLAISNNLLTRSSRKEAEVTTEDAGSSVTSSNFMISTVTRSTDDINSTPASPATSSSFSTSTTITSLDDIDLTPISPVSSSSFLTSMTNTPTDDTSLISISPVMSADLPASSLSTLTSDTSTVPLISTTNVSVSNINSFHLTPNSPTTLNTVLTSMLNSSQVEPGLPCSTPVSSAMSMVNTRADNTESTFISPATSTVTLASTIHIPTDDSSSTSISPVTSFNTVKDYKDPAVSSLHQQSSESSELLSTTVSPSSFTSVTIPASDKPSLGSKTRDFSDSPLPSLQQQPSVSPIYLSTTVTPSPSPSMMVLASDQPSSSHASSPAYSTLSGSVVQVESSSSPKSSPAPPPKQNSSPSRASPSQSLPAQSSPPMINSKFPSPNSSRQSPPQSSSLSQIKSYSLESISSPSLASQPSLKSPPQSLPPPSQLPPRSSLRQLSLLSPKTSSQSPPPPPPVRMSSLSSFKPSSSVLLPSQPKISPLPSTPPPAPPPPSLLSRMLNKKSRILSSNKNENKVDSWTKSPLKQRRKV